MKEFLNKPIIFFGTGRSGSTIISEIILKHRTLAFPSNYHHKYPTIESVNYLRQLLDNRFWRLHGMKSQSGVNMVKSYNRFLFIPSEAWNMWNHILPSEIPFSRGFLLNEKADKNIIASIRAYFLRLIQMQGRERLGLKITGPGRLTYLQSIFPDAVFVHIKRRIVPTISSFLKAPFWQRQGMHQLWWNGVYTDHELLEVEQNGDNPVWMTSFQVKKILDVIELEKEVLKSKVIDVSYDDFLINPVVVIGQLLNDLEMVDKEDCMEFLHSLNVVANSFPDAHYFGTADLVTIQKIFHN
jgi:hypothetical protein